MTSAMCKVSSARQVCQAADSYQHEEAHRALKEQTSTCDAAHQCGEFLNAVEKLVAETRAVQRVRPADSEGMCDMPDTCGPSAWKLLHGLMQAFNDHVCSLCGEVGIALGVAMHDAVNGKLGKPMKDPENFASVQALMEAARKNAGSGAALAAHGYPGLKEAAMSQQQFEPYLAAMQRLMAATPNGNREIGVDVCRSGHGPVTQGDADHVTIPLVCSGQNPRVFTFHEHTRGSRRPSDTDFSQAAQEQVSRIAIGVPQTGSVDVWDVARRLRIGGV